MTEEEPHVVRVRRRRRVRPEAEPAPTAVRVRRRRTVQPSRRRPRWPRRVLLGAGLVVLVGACLGAWFAASALGARSDVTAAQRHGQAARAALLSGDGDTARRQVELAQESAAAGREHAESPVWSVAAHVPVVGGSVATARSLVVTVDDVATQVLGPAAEAGAALSPERLRPSGNRVDLTLLTGAREPLERAADAAARLDERVAALPRGGAVGVVDDARGELAAQTSELADLLRGSSTAATLLPPMLGADGPRRYFLGFQTNAEARGTGGLLGGFGIVDADQGAVSLDRVASNQELRNDAPQGIDLGPEFAQLYSRDRSTTLWQNSNISPHFPYAAQIWTSLWERQTGQRLDGALATDPVALSYLLGAVGPVTLPGGEVVAADDVVRLAESDVYARFADDNEARKAFLTTIASAVFDKVVTAPSGRTTALLTALGRAAGEGRLMVWSADDAEQRALETTPLAHAVPETTAPYANVVLTNASAGKIDYYVGRSIAYTSGGCSAPTRDSTVSVSLTSSAPTAGLPEYVAGRLDAVPSGPPGTVRELVTLYATAGATLRGVTVGGAPRAVAVGSERGHPVFVVDVQVEPGATTDVRFDLVEPTTEGPAQVPVQPLVQPVALSVDVPECRLVRG